MKSINTSKGTIIEDFDKPHVKKITTTLINRLFKPINYNKTQIFNSVASIEWILNKIISNYFYGPFSGQNKEYRIKFNSLILSSDWCSFATKRKLVIHIVNESKLLEGKSKQIYTELLRDTMSYRNALTHGETSTDGRIVKLKYFEGAPKSVILNQGYFDKAESIVNHCFELTNEIASKMGLKKERAK